jgi:hypothetical protein
MEQKGENSFFFLGSKIEQIKRKKRKKAKNLE